MSILDSRFVKAIFGGDPRENERRYLANQELKAIADLTHPWTEAALRAAVREWLDGGQE